MSQLSELKFSDDFIWYDKEFQTFGPRYIKFFANIKYQILLDSTLEFQDLVYIFVVLDDL